MSGSPTNSLNATLDRIRDLDWGKVDTAQEQASSLLARCDPRRLLADLKAELRQAIEPGRSVEKSTHYKWLIAEDSGRRFEFWLHEYKPSTHRRTGHATVPHNHRFWLTSLILRGGFDDIRYKRSVRRSGGESMIEPVTSRSMRTGDTMVISPDEIHSLAALRDGTLSLIVQSRAVRSYSEVFEDGAVKRYSDLDAKLVELGDSL